MATLKSLTDQLPGGFQILHVEAGMEKPFSGSFSACCNFERDFRKKNPFICKKQGFGTAEKDIEEYVKTTNIERCIAHGWTTFLVTDGPELTRIQIPQKKSPGAAGVALAEKGKFVGHVKKAAAGIGLYRDWLGDSLEPVSQELAEKRAWTCAVREDGKGCPKNQPGDFFQRVEAKVADSVRTVIEIAKDLKLRTSLDDKLHTCAPCDCPLQIKVWPKLEHIVANTSEKTMSEFDPKCWIYSEQL